MAGTFPEIENRCYIFLAIIGIPVNLLGIVILSRGKCGLSACTSRYLVAMAAVDQLVLIVAVILWRLVFHHFPGSFIEVTPVCSTIAGGFGAVTDFSVWFTVAFSFDRFIAICCDKLRVKYCTVSMATAVLASVGAVCSIKNIPIYFTLEPEELIDNIPWGCPRKQEYYSETGWVAFDWFDKVSKPLFPFALVLLLNALTVRHILVASQIRKRLRGQRTEKSRGDPEMESRRKSVILLFAVTGNFILLWLPYVINFVYYYVARVNPDDDTESTFIFQQVAYMMLTLSCCTNTFIYAATQSKFRQQLQNAIKYPVISIGQLVIARVRRT
ncbi:probable G-protein coupled receptor 139 [Hypanus sabinus]|uniref:probable G-protein coupled receptor 139 n=1 Tax=Hypanus sabinus TaxID=79690 RepID=UPI0028C3AD49|nr:probable G-protein coupled receptor 139 [Hypanus sabinus]